MRLRNGSEIVGTLDVGSNKIACLIYEIPAARRGEQPVPRILGFGHQRSRGVQSGVIIHPGEAETAIRLAVANAEQTAGVTLNSVYAAITCGRLSSLSFVAHADIARVITTNDVNRVFEGARAYAEQGVPARWRIRRR
jgi:cell division protein FtsA